MAILTVNTGSSSVRLAAYEVDATGGRLAEARHSGDTPDPEELLGRFVSSNKIQQIAAVVHRIVHGGPRLTQPCVIDESVDAEIRRLIPLAPLHNPRALEWIGAARRLFGESPLQVAVFDTAFFADLPEVAATYAIPLSLQRKHGIRRFGFHGLAHAAMWRQWCERAPGLAGGGRCISLQLGSGCSVAAVDAGRPIDTSMGFSPLEGLVMATRCGDLDPGVVSYLYRSEGMTADRIDSLLNDRSGLLGISEQSGDVRALLRSDTPEARLALDVYCYRARKYIGGYVAALGGVDAVLFGGGVGENAAAVRAKILAGLSVLGIELDPAANEAGTAGARCISTASSRVPAWVLPVDEAEELAAAGREQIAAHA
jgi:acetate kinase